MSEQRYDTIFSLPSVDDDPDTEIGVLLMGLGPERLLAGLGVAARDPAADAATVTLLVDQLRHGDMASLPLGVRGPVPGVFPPARGDPGSFVAGASVLVSPEAGGPLSDMASLERGVRGPVPLSTFADAVADGTRRWLLAREASGAADLGPGTRSAALRKLWERAAEVLAAGAAEATQLRTKSAAEQVYLTACWLRPEEINRIAEENRVLSERPS